MQVPQDRLSVLLIEDETLISLDLCDTLVQAGYAVIGPATTVAGAMFLLRQQTPHLAIVDVLLRDGPCSEIADQLRARHVPFVVYSGYGRHAATIASFSGERCLEKTSSPAEIIKVLGELSQRIRAPSATDNLDTLTGDERPSNAADASCEEPPRTAQHPTATQAG